MITIDVKNNNNEVIGNASFKLKESKDMYDISKDEIFLFEGKVCKKDKFYPNVFIYDLFTNEKIELSTSDRNNVCFTLELVEG